MSTLFAILSSLLKCLHYFPLSAVWSGSTLFAILSKQYYHVLQCLPFSAVWSGSTLLVILSSLGWLCWGLTSQSTIFQSCRDGAIASWEINQYFWGVKCLAQGHNTAAVGLEPRTSRSGVRHSTTEPPRSPSAVWSGPTLFAILSSLIRVYNICNSFQAVFSRSASLAILSSLIRVYTICHSQRSDQGLHFLSF